MAFSLECVFPRPGHAQLQPYEPSWADTLPGALLDGVPARLSVLLHDAGILFAAVLSCPGPAPRLSSGHRECLDATGSAPAGHYGAGSSRVDHGSLVGATRCSNPWRHLC